MNDLVLLLVIIGACAAGVLGFWVHAFVISIMGVVFCLALIGKRDGWLR